jgi:hypothetical protein
MGIKGLWEVVCFFICTHALILTAHHSDACSGS